MKTKIFSIKLTILLPKTIIYLPVLFLFYSCSNKLVVQKEAYNLKTFGNINDQTVDIGMYKSPNLRYGQDADKLVVVCASGGGSRAASYTIGVLLELENILTQDTQQKPNVEYNVLNEIDFFSTTSGGGWGTSAFISYKYLCNKYQNVYKTDNPFKTFNSYEEYLANRVDWRYARHQIRYFILDIIGKGSHKSDYVIMKRLNTGYIGWSHRAEIEKSIWETNNSGRFDEQTVDELLLSDVFKLKDGNETPYLPMQIANTTNIDNFKLVPYTPDRLHYWGLSQYTEILGNRNPLNQLNPLDYPSLLNIPFAAGIKASSSVPGFIGSTNFKSKKDDVDYYLHLQDGGIVDNQGLHTAKAIFSQEPKIKEKSKRILIIIDASGSGVQNDKNKYKKQNANRKYSVRRVTLNATPDAQYPLMRERIIAMEEEYNCTVIYLGTEILLDTNFGAPGTIPEQLKESKRDAENKFYDMYKEVLKSTEYFTSVSINDRCLLYEYIRSEVPTWFSSNSSSNKGKYLIAPEDSKGSGKIMFLAGRGVVQLKRNEISSKFNDQ